MREQEERREEGRREGKGREAGGVCTGAASLPLLLSPFARTAIEFLFSFPSSLDTHSDTIRLITGERAQAKRRGGKECQHRQTAVREEERRGRVRE